MANALESLLGNVYALMSDPTLADKGLAELFVEASKRSNVTLAHGARLLNDVLMTEMVRRQVPALSPDAVFNNAQTRHVILDIVDAWLKNPELKKMNPKDRAAKRLRDKEKMANDKKKNREAALKVSRQRFPIPGKPPVDSDPKPPKNK